MKKKFAQKKYLFDNNKFLVFSTMQIKGISENAIVLKERHVSYDMLKIQDQAIQDLVKKEFNDQSEFPNINSRRDDRGNANYLTFERVDQATKFYNNLMNAVSDASGGGFKQYVKMEGTAVSVDLEGLDDAPKKARMRAWLGREIRNLSGGTPSIGNDFYSYTFSSYERAEQFYKKIVSEWYSRSSEVQAQTPRGISAGGITHNGRQVSYNVFNIPSEEVQDKVCQMFIEQGRFPGLSTIKNSLGHPTTIEFGKVAQAREFYEKVMSALGGVGGSKRGSDSEDSPPPSKRLQVMEIDKPAPAPTTLTLNLEYENDVSDFDWPVGGSITELKSAIKEALDIGKDLDIKLQYNDGGVAKILLQPHRMQNGMTLKILLK